MSSIGWKYGIVAGSQPVKTSLSLGVVRQPKIGSSLGTIPHRDRVDPGCFTKSWPGLISRVHRHGSNPSGRGVQRPRKPWFHSGLILSEQPFRLGPVLIPTT
jgi:hypothetical protein